MKNHAVGFFGTPEFAVPALDAIHRDKDFHIAFAISQPTKSGSKGKQLVPAVADYAVKHSITLFQPERITKKELERIQRETEHAECIVLAAYGNIISQEMLSMPPFGWINIHPSLLPKYRGSSPVAAPIRNGDSETGVSIIAMNAELDAGDILAQEKFFISPDDTRGSLTDKLSHIGAKLVTATLHELFNGTSTRVPQNHSAATFTKRFRKEDGRIPWELSAEEIVRHIRSVSPWPGAFCTLEKERIKILSAHAQPYRGPHQNPGTIIVDGMTCAVVCGAHTLLIPIIMQRAGKKPQTNDVFTRGMQLAGKRFT